MRFALLGPLTVTEGTRELPVSGQLLRTALTTLLLDANQAVSVDRLIHALWGENPPRSAAAALRNQVMRIRDALGDENAQRIRTGDATYEIRVGPGELDLDDFARGCADGLRAVRESRWSEGSAQLTSALALWRGEPLAGLRSPLAEAEHRVQQLHNTRLLAHQGRIEAELHLGRHHEVGEDLLDLVADHPLHEPFHGQLMLALYRSGRQAEALEVYRALRRTLKVELAVEPSAEIRDLHQRILRNDPGLAPRSAIAVPAETPAETQAATTQSAPCAAPIAQLPADILDFTGRERETEQILQALAVDAAAPGRVPVVTVTGGAGLGKTTLAIHAAHQVAHGFPDGQLYVDLRGADPEPREAGDVLASFLSCFGMAVGDLPADVHERAARFRAALGGRRVLVVLDNALDPGQIRPLIPAAAGCAVLVTSRNKLSGIAGARRVDLDLLPATDAACLLELIIGRERVRAEPAAAASIVDSCGGLPLALRIAGARLADRPSWTLARFADRLADRRRRLNELSVSDLAVRASFELSYAALRQRRESPSRGCDADEVFRIATLVPATTFGAAEVAALLAGPESDVEDALQLLVNAHLLTEHDEGRYRFHDLIRSYASELLEDAATAEERDRALRRLTYWYGACMAAAVIAIDRGKVRLPPGEPEPGAPAAPDFPEPRAAVAWCAQHAEAAAGAVQVAAACGRPGLAASIAVEMMAYAVIDLTFDWGACLEHALQVATEHGDIRGQAWLRHRLGVYHGLWRRPAECVAMFESALALHRAAHDEVGEVLALGNLASGLIVAEEYESALEHGRQALARAPEVPEAGVKNAQILNAMADAYLALHQYEQAVEHYQRALALFAPDDISYNRAVSLNNLGDAYRGLGRRDDAVASIEKSLEISAKTDNGHLNADSLHTLGRVHAHFGDLDRARDCWRRSLQVFEEIGFAPGAEDVAADLASLDREIRE